ncbi:clostripain-related cysteine peptidase [Candidatus Eisenbacteria bacterium]|uniref:Clostripain-related cysteine peptidase n=1 Tax=Eiseniibacteriota bacterium TaxID=2212470 RepID=A0ABV6YLS1_UNCEI
MSHSKSSSRLPGSATCVACLLAAALLLIPQSARAGVLLNEIQFSETISSADSTENHEWIELVNAQPDTVNIENWAISNSSGDLLYSFPDVTFPDSCYLVVHFAMGDDDLDFSDGSGNVYTGETPGANDRLLVDEDAVALFNSLPAPSSIIDFVTWKSDTTGFSGGLAFDWAVQASIWEDSTFVDIDSKHSDAHEIEVCIPDGHTLARDAASADTDSTHDWDPTFGYEAFNAATMGAVNFEEIFQVIVGGAEDDPIGPDANQHKRWALYVYMVGDCADLHKSWWYEVMGMRSVPGLIERQQFEDHLHIVVQFDGHNGYSATRSTGGTYRIYLEPDTQSFPTVMGNSRIRRIAEKNSGDPNTLSAFITWARNNYPADNYALVIAGHGGGWKGCTRDDGSRKDRLQMGELRDALQAGGLTFNVVFLRSCLMGMIEVATQLNGRTEYLVFSEEVDYGVGGKNTALMGFPWFKITKRMYSDNASPLALAIGSIDDFGEFRWDPPADSPLWKPKNRKSRTHYTLSAINTRSDSPLMTWLLPELDVLSSDLNRGMEDYGECFQVHGLTADNANEITRHAWRVTEKFSDSNFLDLGHFNQNIHDSPLCWLWKQNTSIIRWILSLRPPDAGATIMRETHGTGHPFATGLSIYFPENQWEKGSGRKNDSFDFPKVRATSPRSQYVVYAEDTDTSEHGYVCPDDPWDEAPTFLFPPLTHWDEFVHRYYKPVADAGEDRTAEAGAVVTLSGCGSGDVDDSRGILKYYWDHNAAVDTDDLDTDKNRQDEDDDDGDDSGGPNDCTSAFTCPDAGGEFLVVLTVWDDHHTLHDDHGDHHGPTCTEPHWKTDQDTVKITCEETTLVSGIDQITTKGAEFAIAISWLSYSKDVCEEFMVLRADEPAGPYVQVNPTPIRNVSAMWPAEFTFVDDDVSPGRKYYYRLGLADSDGTTHVVSEIVSSQATGPLELGIARVHPNPTKSSTGIVYNVPADEGHIQMDVFDVRGRLVKCLLSGKYKPGRAEIGWDGMDANGKLVPAGVYFIRIHSRRSSGVVRLAVVK